MANLSLYRSYTVQFVVQKSTGYFYVIYYCLNTSSFDYKHFVTEGTTFSQSDYLILGFNLFNLDLTVCLFLHFDTGSA